MIRTNVSGHVTASEYKRYVENYIPFPWDSNENDPRADIRGKHNILMSYMRFYKIVQYIQLITAPINSVVDVGPYPGSLVSILRDLLGSDAEYCGIGLGFSDEYKEQMDRLNASLFETDIDPEFVDAKECKEWPCQNTDVCFLLDAIEHLTNPVFCLDQINKSLRLGGSLILTTDNISCLGYTYGMLRSGRSPNIHPLSSSMFYRGDWRPHFREYSRDELAFYLQYCGFKVMKHEYFERKQGDYYLDGEGKVREKSRYSGIKGMIVKNVVKHVPHLRDHHIILAEKVQEFDANIKMRPGPTHSLDEWIRMRSDANLF